MTERAMIQDPSIFFELGCGRCDRYATPECSTRRWIGGLLELRRICRDLGLVETAKWGHPTYMHAGRNIVLVGAFQDNFRLGFMNAALMKDPERVLRVQGAAGRTPDQFLFTDNAQVRGLEPTIRAYLQEAMRYAEAGVRPPKVEREIELPDELVEALEGDPELAVAFEALTPGRKRGYCHAIASAKQPRTRFDRIEKFRDKILAGKGPLDR